MIPPETLGPGDTVRALSASPDQQAGEAPFRRLADAAPAILWVTAADGQCVFLSKAWYALTGQTEAEALGLGWLEAVHPDDRAMTERTFLAANARSEPFRLDYRLRRRDGSYGWAIDAAQPHFDDDGGFQGYVGNVFDIDDRKRAEEALRASEERYRTLFESIDEGFCIIEVLFEDGRAVDYRFLDLNPAFERHTGLVNAVGRTARELVPSLEPHWFERYGEVALTGEPLRFSDNAAAMDGRWFDVYAMRLGDPAERRVAILFTDVSDRKRAERALHRLNRTLEERVEERTQQVRRLALRLARAEQKERQRLAQVLHDDLQQRIFALQLRAELMIGVTGAGDFERLAELARQSRDWLAEALAITRQLTVDLSPPVLWKASLGDLLRWLAGQAESLHGLAVEVRAAEDLAIPNEDVRAALLQAIRELLFNVVKHAGTQRAVLAVRSSDTWVVISVCDDGRGFDPSGTNDSFGIASVNERLQLFGGRLKVESEPGAGTRAEVFVPRRYVLDGEAA